jgi:AraC-like DNA-binding protein
MLEETIPIYELQPDLGGIAGFRVWDFKYHDGIATAPDGKRASIAFRHRHPHFEIFWVRKGRGVLALEREIIEVSPRSLLIIGPGDVHFWTETQRLEGATVAVSELFTSASNFSLPFSQLTSFLQPNGSRIIRLSPLEDALIGNVFEIIKDSGDVGSNFDQHEVLKALLLILFSKIHGFHVGRGASNTDLAVTPLARDFKQALLTECPRLTTVKEFADHLKVSRSYLHRAVLHDTGRTPSDLIRDRIVFEAKRLLLHTDNSLKEIAQHLGFRNASYFSSFFRRHTELSPKSFRSKLVA